MNECKLTYSYNKTERSVFLKNDKNRPQCKIKIKGNCRNYPQMSNKDYFHDNKFGGPKPTTYNSCANRRNSWINSCYNKDINMKYIECNGKVKYIYGKSNTLVTGRGLDAGDYLISNNRKYRLYFQRNGNICLYQYSPYYRHLWCMTSDLGSIRNSFRGAYNRGELKDSRLNLQLDGNLCITRNNDDVNTFCFGNSYWQSEINKYYSGNKTATKDIRLVMQDDSNVVVYGQYNKVLWALWGWRGRVKPWLYLPGRKVYVAANRGAGPWGSASNGWFASSAQWVWSTPGAAGWAPKNQHRSFGYVYNVGKDIQARIRIMIDDSGSLYLNDRLIANTGGGWGGNPAYYDVTLYKGGNKIVVYAVNGGGPAGLMVSVYNRANGQHLFSTNSNWKFW